MDALATLVVKARDGDTDAFTVIVGRFQDMAVGYAYSKDNKTPLALAIENNRAEMVRLLRKFGARA